MTEISVVLPSYNTEDLAKNVSEVRNELGKITKDYEVVIVNDGSTKNWNKELRKLLDKKDSKVKILSYDINRGKGHALKRGGMMAKGDKIVFLDADLDIHPKQIKLYLNELDKNKIIVGSKRHPKSKLVYPITRRFMSSVYQLINSILFNLNVKDTQVGIKAFDAKALKKILPKLAIKRYAFDLELLVVANNEGYNIKEAPVEIEYRFGSMVRLKSIIDMLWETAAIFYRLKILKHYDK